MGKNSGSASAMGRAIERLSRLPGIGKRSAERIAFYLLKSSAEEAELLAHAIEDLKKQTRQCSLCWNISESDPCPICQDNRRDQKTLLVVEQPSDVANFETTGAYNGLYHVLMGRLAPLDGVGPGDLTISALLERVDQQAINEVIIGTNPTLEGDGTALYLADAMKKKGVSVSRLARGLPTGANLEMVSKAVLVDAIHGRQGLSK
ncbi:MAG: recombination protein RecR [Phycisphaeraceae bacterium]|nr:recombination protein RecR [Phycisphaeraceae bacterium]